LERFAAVLRAAGFRPVALAVVVFFAVALALVEVAFFAGALAALVDFVAADCFRAVVFLALDADLAALFFAAAGLAALRVVFFAAAGLLAVLVAADCFAVVFLAVLLPAVDLRADAPPRFVALVRETAKTPMGASTQKSLCLRVSVMTTSQ